MSECTIVMYHYVQEPSKSRYPNINALTVEEFQFQLDYLDFKYSFITMEDLQSALRNDGDLAENAVLLTFDDGFAEHYETVFPILKQRGIQGTFFPPVDPIENGTVLDVHKIHTILAKRDSDEQLLDTVLDLLKQYQSQFELESPDQYYDELGEEGRWDPEEIVFVKRLLQHALPEEARRALVDDLFNRYLAVDEETLSQEWYMTKDQLRVMVDDGMYVGSHTENHYWLDTLSRQEVANEIETSLAFLDDIHGSTEEWMMCYPYGGYNEMTIDVLKKYDCDLAFTTESRVANTVNDNPLKLPRLDTNDLPQSPGRNIR